MKTEEIIPDHFPAMKEEDFIAANKRRETYSILRDLQAKEFNGAIISRMEKDKEKLDSAQQVKCVKCGKEYSVVPLMKDSADCPHCN